MRDFLQSQNQSPINRRIYAAYVAALAVLLVTLGSADSLAQVLGCSCM